MTFKLKKESLYWTGRKDAIINKHEKIKERETKVCFCTEQWNRWAKIIPHSSGMSTVFQWKKEKIVYS
jgi:hypothetical protein